jgi:putative endonuclease
MTTRSTATHLALGAEGEARAARQLARPGFRIVARNGRVGGVELDLVARRGRVLVFVEVKTRRTTRFGSPESSVDARKRGRLVRGAAAWLAENAVRAVQVRFDVIACEVSGAGSGAVTWRIRHIPAAFDAGED